MPRQRHRNTHRREPRFSLRQSDEPLRRRDGRNGRERHGIPPHMPRGRLPQYCSLHQGIRRAHHDNHRPTARPRHGRRKHALPSPPGSHRGWECPRRTREKRNGDRLTAGRRNRRHNTRIPQRRPRGGNPRGTHTPGSHCPQRRRHSRHTAGNASQSRRAACHREAFGQPPMDCRRQRQPYSTQHRDRGRRPGGRHSRGISRRHGRQRGRRGSRRRPRLHSAGGSSGGNMGGRPRTVARPNSPPLPDNRAERWPATLPRRNRRLPGMRPNSFRPPCRTRTGQESRRTPHPPQDCRDGMHRKRAR